MIQELKWDTELFGRKIGRLTAVASESELAGLVAQAMRQRYQYLTCRLTAGEISSVQLLERQGFYLTDFGIIWQRDVRHADAPRVEAKEGSVEDSGTVRKIACGLFRDGRFYHDSFFSNEEADKVYQTWAENSLRGFADKVFIIGEKGFITCKISGDTGDIPLVGVSSEFQGSGIGTELVLNALRWFQAREIRNVTVRTQAGNTKASNFYERLGFTMKVADITMGKVLR